MGTSIHQSFWKQTLATVWTRACVFCGTFSLPSARAPLCAKCAEHLVALDQSPIVRLSVRTDFSDAPLSAIERSAKASPEGFSLAFYDDWWRGCILNLKQTPSNIAANIIAKLIYTRIIKLIEPEARPDYDSPLYWSYAPGNIFKAPHLVEVISAVMLRDYAHAIAPAPFSFQRHTGSLWQKPQKQKSALERRLSSGRFKLTRNKSNYARRTTIIFDDVITTGSTILELLDILKSQTITTEDPPHKIYFVALAFTKPTSEA